MTINDGRILQKQVRLKASRDQQTKIRNEHKRMGRKVVNIWIDADIYSLIKQIEDKHKFPNIRETTYYCVKRGVEFIMPDRLR
jgi:hypothetical protein